MKEAIPRIDTSSDLADRILPFCRLRHGDIWTDPEGRHLVAAADASSQEEVRAVIGERRIDCAVQDPPYNLTVGGKNSGALFRHGTGEYIDFSRQWVANTINYMAENSHLYIWLGADQNDHFQPLPDFMLMMRDFPGLCSRSFITVRNQRGYGTQKNWMCVRQELLYYTKGNPEFSVVYTDIPKVLKGYYKTVGGKKTENIERSKSDTIRPGNVWLDIQQVFYRMEENVPGTYAQKPLKAILRIIESSTAAGDTTADFFSHAGTTLIASEILGRRCVTFDISPIYAELTIRRLEHFRKTGKTGWQCAHPFPEIGTGPEQRELF
jgi:site-specific DNA-methyltransferase (adenine-specific)